VPGSERDRSFVGSRDELTCASAHHWGRTLERVGHTVRLMAPQFVKPYVKTNKNDAADAEAICEAVSRPNMRFVPIRCGVCWASLGWSFPMASQ